MSMTDYITCKYQLPGDPPSFVRSPGYPFHTRDLSCTMAAYEITEDGHLEDSDGHRIASKFTGAIIFYGGNSVGLAQGFEFTRDGEDAESVEYRATFVDGRLREIVEKERTREPALPHVEMDWEPDEPETEAEIDDEARQAEQLAGRAMFLLWGGSGIEDGATVKVVYDGVREWAVEHLGDVRFYRKGKLELIDRGMRDRILFDDRAAAEKSLDADAWRREAKRKRWAGMLAARGTTGKPTEGSPR